MRLRFFTIPVHGGREAAEELDGFLASHRILAVDRHLVQDGANSAWAVCVGFVAGEEERGQPKKRGKIDYREVLNEQDFAVFARMRALRKELAEGEGVPPLRAFHQRAARGDGSAPRADGGGAPRDRRRRRVPGGEVRPALVAPAPRGVRSVAGQRGPE